MAEAGGGDYLWPAGFIPGVVFLRIFGKRLNRLILRNTPTQNRGQPSIYRYFIRIVSELQLIRLRRPESKVDLRALISI
jgi:hypothetical protein